MSRLEDNHFWFVGKRYFIQTYLDPIKDKIKKILDVGSGTGGATKFLQFYGDVIGIEKNPTALKLAKLKNLKLVKGEAEKLPFAGQTFDLVTILDVLYHKDVDSVEKVIREARRVLLPSGYLLITDSAFKLLKGGHADSVFEKRRFTLSELENNLVRNGFAIIRSSYIFMSLFPLIFIKRFLIDKIASFAKSDVFMPPSVFNSLFQLLLQTERFLLRYFKLPIGSSLIILARKKWSR